MRRGGLTVREVCLLAEASISHHLSLEGHALLCEGLHSNLGTFKTLHAVATGCCWQYSALGGQSGKAGAVQEVMTA